MAKKFISNATESSRMFKSNFLESLSKVHYSVPLFVFIPVIGWFSYQALFTGDMSVLKFAGFVFEGLFIWSFTEYFMHRFVFHFNPKGKVLERIHFIFHGYSSAFRLCRKAPFFTFNTKTLVKSTKPPLKLRPPDRFRTTT